MKLLEERIKKDGIVAEGDILKVDSFLNHCIDVELLRKLGMEFKRLYDDCGITKILTIESSGIGIACITAQFFGCPVIFAKKRKTINLSSDVYTTQVHSYTHGITYDVFISNQFVKKEDKVLIIDDFLANGCALLGLVNLIRQAGAEIVGAGIAIEKVYQGGGKAIREQGIRVESLARIESMSVENGCVFID